ncbi:MAG: hypothetical protein JO297_17470 [Nitrososphaeraceae archaeon]|nr:hypothetical protein [Nitrososphaeraceae archaeon]
MLKTTRQQRNDNSSRCGCSSTYERRPPQLPIEITITDVYDYIFDTLLNP